MSTPLDITPESLDLAGTQLTTLAQQMMDDLQQLQGTVTGSVNPWGADEQGSIFAMAYGYVLNAAMECRASIRAGHALRPRRPHDQRPPAG